MITRNKSCAQIYQIDLLAKFFLLCVDRYKRLKAMNGKSLLPIFQCDLLDDRCHESASL
jgi:hypothetical protein